MSIVKRLYLNDEVCVWDLWCNKWPGRELLPLHTIVTQCTWLGVIITMLSCQVTPLSEEGSVALQCLSKACAETPEEGEMTTIHTHQCVQALNRGSSQDDPHGRALCHSVSESYRCKLHFLHELCTLFKEGQCTHANPSLVVQHC